MTQQFKLPSPDAPAEEWGRVAVALPGWRWMPGMRALPPKADRCQRDGQMMSGRLPDPDDPATEGCLFRMMSNETDSLMLIPNTSRVFEWYDGSEWQEQSLPLGRACIAVAAALGEWPGGAE